MQIQAAVLWMMLAGLLALAASCSRPPAQQPATDWQVVAEAQLTPRQQAQRDKALAAKDAMFISLKGRLMEVVGSQGPAAAISVCSQEAPQIAGRISQEHGLAIGRTSFKVRNPKNTPPGWATKLVTDRTEKPTYLAHNGKLACLLPIRLQQQCIVCHGAVEAIPPPVKEALDKHYPDDQATGFQDGDLRGWFWVEVPVADGA
jgi:hypothetical protein